MKNTEKPTGVHLVGSAPVENAEEMFRLSMIHLGKHIRRLPDGEVGERDTWIRWQFARILASDQVEQTEQENIYVPRPPMQVVDGISSPEEIEFPDLGYAAAAIESYAVFKRLFDEGVIPGDIRFMVGLPTPLSVAIFYIEPGSRDLFEAAYARAIENEFRKMLEKIPAEHLSIQWETVAEFGLLEGLMENHLEGNLLENITDRLAGLVDMVPEPVEAGIHLCYGDSGHKHFCEPTDCAYLVQVARGIAQKAHRQVAWIHMPVPRERNDAAYFQPLADLELPVGTELYLGLVHATGGLEGTQVRIDAASAIVDNYGLATECGLGRRERDSIPDLMDQHAGLASAIR